jgi:6-phosphogluconolactonase
VNARGELFGIFHGTRHLSSGAAGASTIHFTADGSALVVTERDANRLETLAVRASGRLAAPVVTPSAGATPFRFDVTAAGVAVVSEAGGTAASAPNGTVSSYERGGGGGSLHLVTDALDAGGRAACWVIATENGRFAFVANGVFAVGPRGSLTAGAAVPTGRGASSGLQGIAAY